MHYIVLDHVERIAAADMLPVLLRLREMTGTTLGLVLISQVAWGLNVFEHDTLRCPKPHQLCFPGYRMQDLLSVHHVTPACLSACWSFPSEAQPCERVCICHHHVMACEGTSCMTACAYGGAHVFQGWGSG